MSVVLDASAALALVLPDDGEAPAGWTDLLASEPLDVPALWHFEVANALATGRRRGRLTAAEAGLAATLLASLGVTTHPPAPLTRLLEVAALYELTAYDAAYLVLAIDTGDTLLTRDAQLARAAASAGVSRG